jgi:hypothetical protein
MIEGLKIFVNAKFLYKGDLVVDIVTHIGEISERNVRKYSNDTTFIERSPVGKKRQDIPCKGFDDKVK